MAERESRHLQVTEHEFFTKATLNRPEARNAIDLTLVRELHALCDHLEKSPRVLVIAGSGGFFAAGADIRELRDRGPEEALMGINSRVFDRVADLPMPTIAAVDGPAIGGGAELAYACDFRVASERAVFANPEVGLGIIAGAGACWRLKELVGHSLATEMLLAGRRLDANEAEAVGLVTRVVQVDLLDDAVTKLAELIGRGAPLALRLTKIALRAEEGSHPAIDNAAQAVLFQTDEKRLRMDQFLSRGK
ncbi:MAG: enoyl-CoA hydratase/isomerase family protein [Acidimicrobiales bacterium]